MPIAQQSFTVAAGVPATTPWANGVVNDIAGLNSGKADLAGGTFTGPVRLARTAQPRELYYLESNFNWSTSDIRSFGPSIAALGLGPLNADTDNVIFPGNGFVFGGEIFQPNSAGLVSVSAMVSVEINVVPVSRIALRLSVEKFRGSDGAFLGSYALATKEETMNNDFFLGGHVVLSMAAAGDFLNMRISKVSSGTDAVIIRGRTGGLPAANPDRHTWFQVLAL